MILFSLFGGLASLAFADSALLDPICGRVQVVRCAVEISSPGAPGPSEAPRPPKPGDAVCEGDRLETGPRSRVRWSMPDGASLELMPGSSARIASYRFDRDVDSTRARVELASGAISIDRRLTQVNRAPGSDDSFEVSAGGQSVALRGPRAAIEMRADGSIRAISFKGDARAALSDGRRLDVRQGEELVLKPAGGRPRRLPPAEARKADLELHGAPAPKRPAPLPACDDGSNSGSLSGSI